MQEYRSEERRRRREWVGEIVSREGFQVMESDKERKIKEKIRGGKTLEDMKIGSNNCVKKKG